jgi:hypothetical protein
MLAFPFAKPAGGHAGRPATLIAEVDSRADQGAGQQPRLFASKRGR